MITKIRKSLHCPKCHTRDKKQVSHYYYYTFYDSGQCTMKMIIECSNCNTITTLNEV